MEVPSNYYGFVHADLGINKKFSLATVSALDLRNISVLFSARSKIFNAIPLVEKILTGGLKMAQRTYAIQGIPLRQGRLSPPPC
jgi:hypothetical protein